MTDDEIEKLAIKHIAPHYGKFGPPAPYQQSDQFRRVKALIEEVERRTMELARHEVYMALSHNDAFNKIQRHLEPK